MKVLDPELRRALTARLLYYKDLGIHDFYRRTPAPAGSAEQSESSDSELLPVIPAVRAAAETDLFAPPLVEAQVADPATALRLIREDIGDCTLCRLHKGRTHLVFGVGNPRAELMFIGEGPGADEDAQGEPFVGRAGQLLNKMIEAMGLGREDVYIANVVKCRPPGNRTPERDECDTCSPFLMRQIAAIRPKVIVALGAVAAKNLLGVNDAMANLRGRWYDFAPPQAPPGYSARLAVTYHPAFLLRDPRQKKEAWKDLQMVMKHLSLPVRQNPNMEK
jgi:DNA polymerase